MPKELTHWHIADRVAAAVEDLESPEIRRFLRAIREHRPEFLFGAVAYDSFFYAIVLRHRLLFTRTADELHGTGGEDTLDRFRRCIPEARDSLRATAFLAGALTHYAADTTFHPLVNYFCNGSKHSRRRHHAFETCLDLYVTRGERITSGTEGGLTTILERCDGLVLRDTAAGFYWPTDPARRVDPRKAFAHHAWVRDRFDRPGWQGLATMLGALGGYAAIVAATVYPPKFTARQIMPQVDTFFGQPISFRHPRTGVSSAPTADELIEIAASRAVELIRSYAAGVPEERGISLDAGCDVHRYPNEAFLWPVPETERGDTLPGSFPWY